MPITSSSSSAAKEAPRSPGSLVNDVQVADGPSDSISELSWSPQANHLAASSWDNLVRIYDLTRSPTGAGVASIRFDNPVLSCHFSTNGQMVVGGGLDKTARLIDLAANGVPAVQVAAHDAAVKTARFFDSPHSNAPLLATASWDRTIKYWDLRSATPIATLSFPERVYSMDIKGRNLVATTPERKAYFVNLQNPTSFVKVVDSTLKKQPRVIASLSGDAGYVMGSIEGRVEINYLNAEKESSNFAFRCHRQPIGTSPNHDIYAINALSQHPTLPEVVASCGADGVINLWDIDKHLRIRRFPTVNHTIPAGAFNGDGTLFAYAISYDWSKGFSTHTANYPNKIMIHSVGDDCSLGKK